MADPKTRSQAIAWMKRQLGGGVVVLELRDEHVEDAFDDAKRWYIGRRGIQKTITNPVTSGTTAYQLPDDVDEVIEVNFPGVYADALSGDNPFGMADPRQIMGVGGVDSGFAGVYQLMAHTELTRKISGSDAAWNFNPETRVLDVHPVVKRTGTMTIRYISNEMTDEEATDDFAKLRFRDRELILRYSVARLKWTLGRVRGKYNEWPGGKSMDGNDLIGEAQAEIEQLNEEILELSRGVPFVVG